MSKFVIRRVASGVKFDLRAANGQTVASSETYRTVSACRKGVESVRKTAPAAPTEDRTQDGWKTLPNPKFELYEDKAGRFRFRLKAGNGRIIAASEGYTAKASCENGIESVKRNAPEAEIEEE